MGGIAIPMKMQIYLDEDNLPSQGTLWQRVDRAVGIVLERRSNPNAGAGGNVHGSMPSGLLAGAFCCRICPREVVSNENRKLLITVVRCGICEDHYPDLF